MNNVLRLSGFAAIGGMATYLQHKTCRNLRQERAFLLERILTLQLFQEMANKFNDADGFIGSSEQLIDSEKQLKKIDNKTKCIFCKIWPQPKEEKLASSASEVYFSKIDMDGLQHAPDGWNTEKNMVACQLGSSKACEYIAGKSLNHSILLPKDIKNSIKKIKSQPSDKDSVYLGLFRRQHSFIKAKKKAQIEAINSYAPKINELAHQLDKAGKMIVPCLSYKQDASNACNLGEITSLLNKCESEIINISDDVEKKGKQSLAVAERLTKEAEIKKAWSGRIPPNQKILYKSMCKNYEELGKVNGLQQVEIYKQRLINILMTYKIIIASKES